jgi:hypothetical protein
MLLSAGTRGLPTDGDVSHHPIIMLMAFYIETGQQPPSNVGASHRVLPGWLQRPRSQITARFHSDACVRTGIGRTRVDPSFTVTGTLMRASRLTDLSCSSLYNRVQIFPLVAGFMRVQTEDPEFSEGPDHGWPINIEGATPLPT